MFEFKADIRLEITYNTKTDKITIKSNAKKETVRRILEDFLTSQVGDRDKNYIGTGRKEEYKIVLELDLKNDDFRVSSDTGSDGSTWGIFFLALYELERSKILPI